MGRPEVNTYIVTVVLRDVSKATAIEFGHGLEQLSEEVGAPYPEVMVAHLKDEHSETHP